MMPMKPVLLCLFYKWRFLEKIHTSQIISRRAKTELGLRRSWTHFCFNIILLCKPLDMITIYKVHCFHFLNCNFPFYNILFLRVFMDMHLILLYITYATGYNLLLKYLFHLKCIKSKLSPLGIRDVINVFFIFP